MPPSRDPLGSINLNTASSSSGIPAKKLAPIFTRSYKRPAVLLNSCITRQDQENDSSITAGPSRKRARLDVDVLASRDDNEREDHDEDEEYDRRRPEKMTSMHDWFITTGDYTTHSDAKEINAARRNLRVEPVVDLRVPDGCWRRRRGRFGMRLSGEGGRFRDDTMASMASLKLTSSEPRPHLEQYVHSLIEDPERPPSTLFIPSLHPWNYPRDFAPPLAVNFSHAAKLYDRDSARAAGLRRLIAVAAEEGGVRIVDCDEGLGHHREAKGWFWRAHGNAVLDLRWTPDDTGVLTASGDQTARLHMLDASKPTLRAILKGHTASLKTAQFFDLSRSFCELDNQSTVITGSRDGNILIFDIRAPGKLSTSELEMGGGARRSARNRYSNGVPGFAPQNGQKIGPVMELMNAHGDGSRKKISPKSITSIACLSSMPGIFASGSANDGVVRLWDPRYLSGTFAHPVPMSTLPDPTCQAPKSRSRGIHSLVEQPGTGDLFALTGDSKIHVLRPSAAQVPGSTQSVSREAIQPIQYTSSDLRSNFWMNLSFSPCGRYLASGSTKGVVMTWDTASYSGVWRNGVQEVIATKLGMQDTMREREMNAVDWGHDMIAACTDDAATRIWRRDDVTALKLKNEPESMTQEWAGHVA